jgi:hypothetical protein
MSVMSCNVASAALGVVQGRPDAAPRGQDRQRSTGIAKRLPGNS